jgi:hypothetical protein
MKRRKEETSVDGEKGRRTSIKQGRGEARGGGGNKRG